MTDELLISAKKLRDLINDNAVLVFDCRFDLFHPGKGYNSWLAAHIPGAVHADLDKYLAGRVTAKSGRHPLPSQRSFAAFLARSGWTPGTKIVAYDSNGSAFASRLWWLMQYFDLGNTVILDGGINAWMTSGFTMESGEVRIRRKELAELSPQHSMVLNTQQVFDRIHQQDIQLLDARETARFEGQVEPIDPIAGHIPGAINHPMSLNLENGSFFRNPAELKSSFRSIIRKSEPSRFVHMCGSGVTACQNLFAMELAGLKGSRLYPGSWSEWIRDPSRPVVKGKV
jgi:thiosulfate/3-mercaptopyruvate sulfurtransferase